MTFGRNIQKTQKAYMRVGYTKIAYTPMIVSYSVRCNIVCVMWHVLCCGVRSMVKQVLSWWVGWLRWFRSV